MVVFLPRQPQEHCMCGALDITFEGTHQHTLLKYTLKFLLFRLLSAKEDVESHRTKHPKAVFDAKGGFPTDLLHDGAPAHQVDKTEERR